MVNAALATWRAHPVIPSGGYGMNTGVGDAIDRRKPDQYFKATDTKWSTSVLTMGVPPG